MLQRLGDSLKGQKWLAYTVLGALALVFAAWGAYGLVDMSFGPGAHAAKVNGDTIPATDVRDAWMEQQSRWQQQFGEEIPEEQRGRLQDQLLEAMVRERLLTSRTHDLGYRVSREQLTEAIRSLPAFQLDGRYSPEVAKARLAQAGMTDEQFRREMLLDLQRQQVQRGLSVSDFVTPRELERILALENEQREVRYAVLPAEKFVGEAAIDDAAVRAYYDANKQDFQTPESVQLRYGELRLDQLTSQVTISDAELRKAYDADKARYVQAERRRVRHILIESGDARTDAAAQQRAQQVLAEARAGKDFAALAKQYSQDPGSAAQGGDLGWVQAGDFSGPFGEAVFAMKPGEIRGPVKSESGYHVIRLDEIQAGRTQSFEEARDELAARLRREQAGELFGDRQEQIELRLEQPGADLETVAKEFGLTLGEVEEFMRGGGGPPLGSSPELQELVFSDSVLNQRRVAGPVPIGEDRLVVVQVTEHRRPEARPLAEVREDIVEVLRQERGTKAAQQAAAEAEKRVKAGASLEAALSSLGVKPEEARYIGRFDPSVPAAVREQAFALPKPTDGKASVSSVTLDGEGAAVLVVSNTRVQPEDDNPALRAQRARQTLARLARRDVAAYVEELRRTADVSKNPQVFGE